MDVTLQEDLARVSGESRTHDMLPPTVVGSDHVKRPDLLVTMQLGGQGVQSMLRYRVQRHFHK